MTITTSTDVALTGISNQRVNQVMATGTLGNIGASSIAGPGYWTFDLALAKTLKVRENKSLEFRAEALNLTNSVRYNNPTSNLNTNTFDQITSAQAPRIMQFALKYVF